MDFIYQFAGWGTTALELALGIVFIVHGWAKIKKPEMMAPLFGGSKAAAALLGFAEVGAGIAVATEFGTFEGTLVMIGVMVGAIFFKITKWHTPFWAHDKTGWEFDLVLLAGALALLLG